MAKRLFELHLGMDQNEVTGDVDYVISGKVSKEAQESFLGGCLFGMLGALDKQTREKKAIEVVETIPVTPMNDNMKALEDKWKKK